MVPDLRTADHTALLASEVSRENLVSIEESKSQSP